MTLSLLLALAASAHTAPAPVPVVADTMRRSAATAAVLHSLAADAVAPVAADPKSASTHALATAGEAGMSVTSLLRAEQAVYDEIRRGGFPGAAIAAGRGSRVVLEQGLGRVGWDPFDTKVDADATVYDLASLTKVIATTTVAMLLVEDGKLDLDAPVSRYLPEFSGPGKHRVTVRHLLTHTSGLPAGADIWASTHDAALGRAIRTPLQREAGARVEYSDIGFVTLWAVEERAAGEPLWKLLDRRVFGPLGMRSTTFLPGEGCARCAPTGRRADGSPLRGLVHDPTARQLGGIAGNAGLFSTAHDLARFAAMLANEGELDSVRVLKAETIRHFTQRQVGAETRALGWDTPAGGARGAAGERLSARAFGHTGFTGTSLWVDPARGTWAVLLANRTFEPRASNRIQALRRIINDWVCDAKDAIADRALSPG